MNILTQLFSNNILIASIFSNIIAQVLKVIFTYLVEKEWDWEMLTSTGGNPSSHTATVTTLTILLGAKFGFDSPYFSIAFVFSAIVVFDAISVRREVGKHAKTMNEIFFETPLGKRLRESIDIETFKELVGHSGIEVFIGFLLGLLIAIIDIIFFF
ncbi:divergent PAP2 family protein [Caldisericum sp. AR60]|uniref:divergent PAP2 family protein n=1 Tax=Caldisericum sp. AR60 TaxID=3397852 RepID=UPI0039FD1326